MGITVTFTADPEATDIASFNIYRSIAGVITAQEPFAAAGKALWIRSTKDPQFTKITIASDDPEEIAEQLNQYGSLKVSIQDVSPNRKLIIRSTASALEFMKTAGSEALGIFPGVYRPNVIFQNIGSVPFVSGEEGYEFEDVDGDHADFYQIRRVNTSAEEQVPETAFQVSNNIVPVCAIEGTAVTSSGGEPLKGALVQATPYLVNDQVSKGPATTYTDDLGRWRLNLVRGLRYYVEIPEADFGNAYVIPDQAAALLKDLLVDGSWRHEDVAIVQKF